MHRAFSLTLLMLLFLLKAGTAFAYSYAEAEDPMAQIFKEAVIAAKEGNWSAVSSLANKGVSLQSNHIFKADFLTPQIENAVAEKKVSNVAGHFANLVYLSIKEKLHQNRKEQFSNYKNSKSRLQLARKSYLDVLDGNIKKNNPDASLQVINNFKSALTSIGNPGLFGIGKQEPDPNKYDQAVKNIEELVEKSFPGFSN